MRPLVVVGSRLLYMARIWRVDRINFHLKWGCIFHLVAEDDGSSELIAASDADGAYEVLPEAA